MTSNEIKSADELKPFDLCCDRAGQHWFATVLLLLPLQNDCPSAKVGKPILD